MYAFRSDARPGVRVWQTTTGDARLRQHMLALGSMHPVELFWPAPGQTGAEWVGASDHRMVWMDLATVGAVP